MNFYETPAIEIKQPFKTFYAFKIPAYKLLQIAFTDPIRYDAKGELVGVQRSLDEKKRVDEIKEFLQGDDAALPNSIILAANYDISGLVIEDEKTMWHIKDGMLVIPTNQKLASIIDGQHRLFGFEDANSETRNMDLLCSVYFDLPNALQANMFATINTTQVKVDRSLAYIQFGFNVENEPITSWPPDKFAIVLYKKFNQETDSPFYHHIKIAAQMSEEMRVEMKERSRTWIVSTATIVDGIVRLISKNPRRDKYYLQQMSINERRRSDLTDDKAPLRLLYLNSQDNVIYRIIFNFFSAADELLLSRANLNSYIIKTVGIQALFDTLNKIISEDKLKDNSLQSTDLTKKRFENILKPLQSIDFENGFQYSGVGRKMIFDTIWENINY